jgi:hypothetical protein
MIENLYARLPNGFDVFGVIDHDKRRGERIAVSAVVLSLLPCADLSPVQELECAAEVNDAGARELL